MAVALPIKSRMSLRPVPVFEDAMKSLGVPWVDSCNFARNSFLLVLAVPCFVLSILVKIRTKGILHSASQLVKSRSSC